MLSERLSQDFAPYFRSVSLFPVVVTACSLLIGSPASGQSCRGLDDNSKFMISDLKKLVSSTSQQEAYQRRDLKIPVVDSATIVLVTQTQTCSKVLTAFLGTLPSDYPTPLPTSVYVVKVGSVFVAMHPPPAGATGSPYAVVDSKYKVLSKYSL